ncbi:MAG: hypothetical protein JNL30_09085 [Rubrivivax sp.]|nr:hypothetical protein [Rubrivivax sp.]
MATTNTPALGYSGTPLAKKLGLKDGQRAWLVDAPPALPDWLAPLPPRLSWADRAGADIDLVHAFFTQRTALARQLAAWRRALGDEVVLWVSWPKKSAKVPTDITEDVIREVALPLGFVDVKVCAVSEVWSGLKLVVRKELRRAAGASAGGARGTALKPAAKPATKPAANNAVKTTAPARAARADPNAAPQDSPRGPAPKRPR